MWPGDYWGDTNSKPNYGNVDKNKELLIKNKQDVNNLKQQIENLHQQIEKLKTNFMDKYKPDNPGYIEAKNHFYSLV